MDAREQPPLTPFALARARRERACEGEAFDFECCERSRDPLGGKAQGLHKLRKCRRTLTFEPPTHELHQSSIGLPSLVSACGCRDSRVEASVGVNCLDLPKPLSRDP